MTRQEIRAEIADLKKREKAALESLGQALAKRERLDDDRLDDEKERKRLKKLKDAGQVYDQQDLARINTEIRIANHQLVALRAKIKGRRNRVERMRRAIKKARVQLRNSVRPKIIDLKLGFRPMATQGSIARVIGHYTAGPQDEDTGDAIRLCRIYHQSHLNQGWSGLGYMLNFTIDGNILLLRPSKYVGSHTLGYNTSSYGIMMHGTTGDKPSRAQKRALQWWAKNGRHPAMGTGQTTVTPGKLPWYGHNDYNPTSCPGEFKETYRTKGHK